jgi:hypothetical protein
MIGRATLQREAEARLTRIPRPARGELGPDVVLGVERLLLVEDMEGISVETVDSSWIDALGGLSQRYIRKVPPGFWA